MIKVMIVDDHVLIRKGIRLLLENYPDLDVVAEASDGAEAITLALKVEPDVVLMDLSMPDGLDGFTAAKEIMAQLPAAKVVLLTMHDEEIYVRKAIHLNIHGYTLKKSHENLLYEAITSVNKGERYYKTGFPEEQLNKLFDDQEKESILTNREQEIVRLAMLGFTNIQISRQLSISPKTVENHKTNIMQKLHLKNKHELIRYGIKNHYLDLSI
ncbi:response regulator [Pseudalkalibacillus caeni]|uniref:Response regulator transcription factor n=1 Tax=Exobacillus caeni TaxID=2574798 RepID=A0A5R9F4D8_9BACL|nr:response regulator transcription factor [Pseudalkalibacillus caeni]TLS37270.1 response regulator transcription factor [Pseudalkalibacillus caeni]